MRAIALAAMAVVMTGCASGDDETIVGRASTSTSVLALEPRCEPVRHDDTVSDAEASAALEIALEDDRVRMGPGCEVVSVARVGPEPFGGMYIRVVLRGDVDQAPAVVCSIGGHSGTITGLVFLVSEPPATVEALSPEWDNAVSCL